MVFISKILPSTFIDLLLSESIDVRR